MNPGYYVVWCLKNQDPYAVLSMFGHVKRFCTSTDAQRFARCGYPMHKGRYRVVAVTEAASTLNLYDTRKDDR